MAEFESWCPPPLPPLPSITTLGKLQGLSSHLYKMRTVIISTWGQFHWQSTSATAYGLCLKGPWAWGLVFYNGYLEILNNSNIFNYSVKSYRAMDHEWGRLRALAHTQFCLLLPLPVLNHLLPSSWCPLPCPASPSSPLTWALLLPSMHRCAQASVHSLGRVRVR